MKHLFIAGICILLLSNISVCQQLTPFVISSAGNFYKPNDISLSFTIGEIAVETFSSSSNILTQGFQQGSWTINAIGSNPNQTIQVNIYPNPANEFVMIEWKEENNTEFHIELYDLTGKKIIHKTSDPNENTFELGLDNLTQSVYILRIWSAGTNASKSFRIIKSKSYTH